MAEQPSDALRMMAKLMLDKDPSKTDKDSDADSLVSETWDQYVKDIKDAKIKDLIERSKRTSSGAKKNY